MANCGLKLSQVRQQLDKTSSIFKKCLTLVCSNLKHEKLEFVQFVENFTAKHLVSDEKYSKLKINFKKNVENVSYLHE